MAPLLVTASQEGQQGGSEGATDAPAAASTAEVSRSEGAAEDGEQPSNPGGAAKKPADISADARPQKRLRRKTAVVPPLVTASQEGQQGGSEGATDAPAAAATADAPRSEAAVEDGEQPESTERFARTECLPRHLSPHPAARLEEELDKLSRCLREDTGGGNQRGYNDGGWWGRTAKARTNFRYTRAV